MATSSFSPGAPELLDELLQLPLLENRAAGPVRAVRAWWIEAAEDRAETAAAERAK